MNILSLLAAATPPHDLWTILINWIQGAVGNYGWTILLVTILVKLIMTPIDFLVKYSTKKQTLIQKKCSPQIAKLQKKFGANQEQLRIQTQAIYKREGLKMGTSCLVMMVNMILTMVVFFTFYGSLRNVSAYEVINQYETLEQSYDTGFKSAIINYKPDDEITLESYDAWLAKVSEASAYVTNPNNDSNSDEWKNQNAIYEGSLEAVSYADGKALENVLATWNKSKDNWLWIDNIWVADAIVSPFPAYADMISTANNGGYGEYAKAIDEASYTKISSHIAKNATRTKNGYYILPILVGLLSFFSQWVTDLHNKLKNKKAQQLAKISDTTSGGNSMKLMKIILPLIMVGFAFTSSTSFGIYLIASSISSLLFGEIITLIIDKMTKKQRLEVEEVLEKEAERMIKKGKLQEK